MFIFDNTTLKHLAACAIAGILILGTFALPQANAVDHIEVIEFEDGDLLCTKTTFEGGTDFGIITGIPGIVFEPTLFPSGATGDSWRTLDSQFSGTNEPSPSTVAFALGPPEFIPRDITFVEPVSKVSFYLASSVDMTVNVYDLSDLLLESNTYPATGNFDTWNFVEINVDTNQITRAEFVMLSNQHVIDDLAWCVGPDTPTFDSLLDQIQSLGLHHGIENALTKKIENAQADFEDGNINGAIGKLNAFINQINAQSGKKIDLDDADDLIESAQALLDAL